MVAYSIELHAEAFMAVMKTSAAPLEPQLPVWAGKWEVWGTFPHSFKCKYVLMRDGG